MVGLVCAPVDAGERQWSKLPTAPYVLNNKQDAVAFAGSGTGWYGNGNGQVYRTNDFGQHWKAIWKSRGTYVRALEFIDKKIGFLGNVGPGYFPDVTDKHPLYMTRDGGDHWSPIAPTAGPRIVGICAIDVLKVDGKVLAVRAGGRVGGPAGMLESFDEGRTFQARDMRSVTGMILDIHFVDANVGFIAGASEVEEEKAHARILKTNDGGKTWRGVFDSDRPGDNNWKLAFPSAAVGYGTIISYQAPDGEARGYVVKTVDGGEHWRRMTVTDDAQWVPYGINFLDEMHGWVGGSTGGFETHDGGQSWVRANMGLSTNKFRFVKRTDGGVYAFAIGQVSTGSTFRFSDRSAGLLAPDAIRQRARKEICNMAHTHGDEATFRPDRAHVLRLKHILVENGADVCMLKFFDKRDLGDYADPDAGQNGNPGGVNTVGRQNAFNGHAGSALWSAGDRVCWAATTCDLGTVVGTTGSGIDWDDGQMALIQHNDMANIERVRSG